MINKSVTFDCLNNHDTRKYKNKSALLEWTKKAYLNDYNSEQQAIKAFIRDASFGIASCGKWLVYNTEIIECFYQPFRDELKGIVMKNLRGTDVAKIRDAIRKGTEIDNTDYYSSICSVIIPLVDELYYAWAGKLARIAGIATPKSCFQRLH